MATGWWHGLTDQPWTTTTNWYTTAAGTTNVSVVPNSATADTANFNANGFAGPYTVWMNGNKAVLGLSINGTATGGVTVKGGTVTTPATNVLTIGLNGITVAAGAGASAVGSATTGIVNITHTNVGYTIANASANTLTLYNTLTNTSASSNTITFSANGAGNIDIRGSLTSTNGNTVTRFSSSGSGAVIITGSLNNASFSYLDAGWVKVAGDNLLPAAGTQFNAGKISSTNGNTRTIPGGMIYNGAFTVGDASALGSIIFGSGSNTDNVLGNTVMTVTANEVLFNNRFTGSANFTINGNNARFLYNAIAGTFSGVFTTSGSLTTIGAYSSGAPNQLAAASRVVVTGGQFLIAGGSAYTFAPPVIGTTGTFYVRNSNASGITFTGDPSALTPNGFTGTFQLYADSNESAATTQRATFTLASQVKFATLAFSNYTGSNASLRQIWRYTGTSAISSTASVGVYASAAGLTGVIENASSNNSAISFSGVVQLSGTQNATLETAATSGSITLSQVISEVSAFTLGFIKSGTYTTTLSNNNTFKGNVAVNAGILATTTSATALGSTSGGALSVASGATLSIGAAVSYGSRSLTIQGTGSTSAPNNGALIIANAGTNTFQSITLGNATLIRGTVTGGTLEGNITNGANTLTLGADTGVTLSVSGVIGSGAGGLTVDNGTGQTGTVFITQTDNTFTGQFVITNGDVAVAKLANNTATSSIGAGSSAIKIGSGTNLANLVWRPSGASAVTQSTNKSFDFAGTTGTVNIRVSGSAPSGSTITFSGGTATFSVAGARTITFGPFTGTAIVWAIALGDSSAGATSLAFDRGGTTTLSTANTYSGGSTLTSGTLKAGHLTALGTGPVTQAAGTVLQTPASDGRLNLSGAYSNSGGTLRIGGS